MMTTTGFSAFPGSFTLLWAVHIVSVIIFFVGVIFLIAWAIKHLSGPKLKMWGIWMLIIGAIACLLTVGFRGAPWMGFGFDGPGGSRMGMSMNGMTMMLQGKTGDSFDEAFIEMMIPHHEGAIDMAELALKNAKHTEIKNLANAIISSQQREINQMKGWLQSWGY